MGFHQCVDRDDVKTLQSCSRRTAPRDRSSWCLAVACRWKGERTCDREIES